MATFRATFNYSFGFLVMKFHVVTVKFFRILVEEFCGHLNKGDSPIHSSQLMFLSPIVMWYGPCLNGRYGFGLVVCTFQLGAGGGVGRLKTMGSHTAKQSAAVEKFSGIIQTPRFSLRSLKAP